MSDLVTEIRKRHVEDIRPWHTEIDGKSVYRTSCVFCLGVWPCDAARAADEIERLQAQVAAADALESEIREAWYQARAFGTRPDWGLLGKLSKAYRATRSGTETGGA